jgi:hypothetical protein
MPREILDEIGTASIRSRLGIEQEDPRVFKPWEPELALRAGRVLERDETIPPAVRRLVALGIVLDLRPGDLTPRRGHLALLLGISLATVRRREIRWEAVDPVVRFDLVRRATSMALQWRAADVYG